MSPNELIATSQEKAVGDLLTNINKQLEDAKTRGAHVLGTLVLQQIPPKHRPTISKVEIDPNLKAKMVYPQKGGGLSLSALSFQRLADAIGIHWQPGSCGRIDAGHDPNLIHYRMVGKVKALDGTWRPIMGDKEIRLETVIQEMTDNYLDKAALYLNDPKDGPAFRKAIGADERSRVEDAPVQRWIREKVRVDALQIKKHMLARAQTGAMARAVKSLGIRETYTADELKQPFYIPKLVPELDMTDPEDRDFVRRQAVGALDMTYPPAREERGGRTALPDQATAHLELHLPPDDVSDVEPAAHAKPDEPTEAEVLRSDFRASTPTVQAEMLKNLMKQKGWTTKLAGEPEVWQAEERAKFLETLLARPDVSGMTKKLPF